MRSRSWPPTSPLRMQRRGVFRRFRKSRKRERSVISCPATRMKSSSSSTMQRRRSMRRSIPGKSIARPPTRRISKRYHRWPTPCRRSCWATTRGPGADAARRLSELLTQLAEADPLAHMRAPKRRSPRSLRISLDQLRQELKPERITTENIPSDVAGEWVTTDGHARVQVLPKGDPEDTEVLRGFATSVLAVEPNATGPAVFLYEARNTVVRAFIEAGIFALSAITILLWIMPLRRMGDVVLTLLPLLVAGVVKNWNYAPCSIFR